MDLKKFDFLAKEVPSTVSEIREALDLLSSSIDSALDEVGVKINKASDDRKYSRVGELSKQCEDIEKMKKDIDSVVNYLDTIVDETEDVQSIEITNERDIPNYKEYLVDQKIEHTLYEDLTHKRPCAFTIQSQYFEVKDWKEVLIGVINYLSVKDKNLIQGFADDPKMNGKKAIYFSRTKLESMRAPREIKKCNLVIETNLSANGIRNLIIKILKKFNINLSDFKIFIRADYSELH